MIARLRLERIESTALGQLDAGVNAALLDEVADASLCGFCLLACDSARAVGGLMIERAAAHEPATWWLHNLYVLPDWRRAGVFTQLFTHVRQLANAEHAARIRASVHRQNSEAAAAFEHLGFRDITALLALERPNSVVDPARYRRLGLLEPPLRVLEFTT